ncbi:hypothetical protein NKH18_15790 [Streptomyces sp. M10(2022)]
MDARTGSSGSGVSSGSAGSHAERSGALRVFAPSRHRHEAEIAQATDRTVRMTATGVEAVRGVQVLCHVELASGVSERDVRSAFRAAYRNEPFVRVIAQRQGLYRLPEPKILTGSNFCDVGFSVSADDGTAVLIGALDNLVKGGAGGAVQCLNVRFGWPERTGLEFPDCIRTDVRLMKRMRDILVVKCGGNAAVRSEAICTDVAAVHRGGRPVILAHGGSADIDRLAERLGVPSRRLVAPDGVSTRYTDERTLEVVQLALAGSVKPRLLAALRACGVDAVGLTGLDAGLSWPPASRRTAHSSADAESWSGTTTVDGSSRSTPICCPRCSRRAAARGVAAGRGPGRPCGQHGRGPRRRGRRGAVRASTLVLLTGARGAGRPARRRVGAPRLPGSPPGTLRWSPAEWGSS